MSPRTFDFRSHLIHHPQERSRFAEFPGFKKDFEDFISANHPQNIFVEAKISLVLGLKLIRNITGRNGGFVLVDNVVFPLRAVPQPDQSYLFADSSRILGGKIDHPIFRIGTCLVRFPTPQIICSSFNRENLVSEKKTPWQSCVCDLLGMDGGNK